MENAEQILVIILSSVLVIFLVLGIVFFVLAIKVVRTVKRVGDKAEAVSELVQKAATPMVLGKALTRLTSIVLNLKSKRK